MKKFLLILNLSIKASDNNSLLIEKKLPKYIKKKLNEYSITEEIYTNVINIQNIMKDFKKNDKEEVSFQLYFQFLIKLKEKNISESVYNQIVKFQNEMENSYTNKIKAFYKMKQINFISMSILLLINFLNIYLFKFINLDFLIEDSIIFNIIFGLTSLIFYCGAFISNFNLNPNKNILYILIINGYYVYTCILNSFFLVIKYVNYKNSLSDIINYINIFFSILFLIYLNYTNFNLLNKIKYTKSYLKNNFSEKI